MYILAGFSPYNLKSKNAIFLKLKIPLLEDVFITKIAVFAFFTIHVQIKM